MKLSLAWIFDHLQADLKNYSVADIVARLSLTTAEIEHVEKVTFDFSPFIIAQFHKYEQSNALLHSQELQKEIILESRPDLLPNAFYLIKKVNKTFQWATIHEFGTEKEGYFPPLWVDQHERTGTWRTALEICDYIMSLDNKAITHRPDLWSHRGFAREIAALFNIKLLPEEHFLLAKPVKHYALRVPRSAQNPFELSIEYPEFCKRFAGIYIDNLHEHFCRLPWALRLLRINARPINALVDAANYVMYDIGQPLHAFDAQKINGKALKVRKAQAGEKLTLLDGQAITLREEDGVVADATKPLALAGIMGGAESGLSLSSSSAFIEAAYFEPAFIRRSATHFKKRTEASSRFEKNLDPHQNTLAIIRLLKIIAEMKVSCKPAEAVESIGSLIQETTLIVTHSLIEQRLGLSLLPKQVVTILCSLGFGVQQTEENSSLSYHITIPTFRATKDIKIPEDIVEEIGRFIGYGVIPAQLPTRVMKPLNHSASERIRTIKHHSAYALHAHEVYNYALFDQEFLQQLGWQPIHAASLANPVSENWRLLVTSLIPHLLKNVATNMHRALSLRFFEWGRTWHLENNTISENKSYAGIFYEQKKSVNFYEQKTALDSLFKHLSIVVHWEKPQNSFPHWFHPYKTAQLMYQDHKLGYAGKINPLFINHFIPGDAFIFELDGALLLKAFSPSPHFVPLVKYQSISFDVSFLVPLTIGVSTIEQAIITADARICDISLVDFFEKEEWYDQKSLTFHITAVDEHKTMTHEEIEGLRNTITQLLIRRFGAQIR